MRNRWAQLGGRLGIGYCIAGFVLVFLGWNGAASYNRTFEQFPYLISGGVAGLGLIIIGAALMVGQSLRNDRVELRASIDELRAAVDQLGGAGGAVAGNRAATGAGVGAGEVLASQSSYHRAGCRVIDGQVGLTVMTAAEAAASGRSACRICTPDEESAA
jgi:hypothetical protein